MNGFMEHAWDALADARKQKINVEILKATKDKTKQREDAAE